MIRAIEIPPVVQPQVWNLIFNRRPTTRWQGWIVPGEFKHVRAYAYVPGMHVWVFYDPHIAATDIFLARDGVHAGIVKVWLASDGEQISMKLHEQRRRWFPPLFYCVPAIKHLLGLRCVAATPDALYRFCLKNGGMPFEAEHESPHLRSAPA